MKRLYQNQWLFIPSNKHHFILRMLKVLAIFIIVLTFTSSVNIAHAQTAVQLVSFIHMMIMGVAVAVGLFLIVINGYKIMGSQGDPRQVQEGREGLTSAIIGLLFVLMSVSILRVILGAVFGTGAPPF